MSENTSLQAAIVQLPKLRYSRIPVIDTSRNVVGILYKKDLLRLKLDLTLSSKNIDSVMRKPLYIHPTLKLNALFRKFKQQRNHMAVLQSSGGKSLSIITMSDVLEELFDDVLPDEGTSA
jgi:putative hemolysin